MDLSWATEAVNEKRIYVAQIRMLIWMCGGTRIIMIKNENKYYNLSFPLRLQVTFLKYDVGKD